MKYLLLTFAAVTILAGCGNKGSQTATRGADILDSVVGEFVTYNLDSFTLHVYNTRDAMRNSSYIIEGDDSLVVMEYPLFRVNAAEFAAYIERIGKPIAVDITDYHLGGSGTLPLTMPEGMPAFIKGPVYSGMMQAFAKEYGEDLVELPTQPAVEVPFGQPRLWAGVTFLFEHGPATDFPGASIIIGSQIYYTHWAPTEAHVSPHQIGSEAALDAQLAEARKALDSGARFFIGGHGGLADKATLEFHIAYLTKLKELRASQPDATHFADALRAAYPRLKGDVDALAQTLYKQEEGVM